MARPTNTQKEINNEIKWFIQRGKRGFSDRDNWCIYFYIAKIMSGSLKELYIKRKSISYPLVDGADDLDKWKDIVKKMIAGFDAIIDMNRDLETEEKMKLANEALDLFRKYYFTLWD